MSDSLWQAVQQESEKRQSTPPPPEIKAPEPIVSKDDRSNERENEPADLPTNAPSDVRPKERRVQRRPYDFYVDQILWLKEMKLEIEKKYGRHITANVMVQLALDLLIQDYERNKDRSKLVRELVSNGT